MTQQENVSMGRKAESIYTARLKNRLRCERKKAACAACRSVRSYEEHIRRNPDARACYVNINGISMPVLSA